MHVATAAAHAIDSAERSFAPPAGALAGMSTSERRISTLVSHFCAPSSASACTVVAAAGAAASSDTVTLHQQADAHFVAVLVGGDEFARYEYGPQLARPYMLPVRTLDSKNHITRPLLTDTGEEQTEHNHHKGIWVAVDEVNGVKFWGERQIPDNVEQWPQGQIVARSLDIEQAQSSPGTSAVLRLHNSWLGRGGNPILEEETHIAIRALGGGRLFEYTVMLTPAAGAGQVTFGDTKEGATILAA